MQLRREFDPGAEFHPTAFNNRLELLRHLELVSRERHGREWFYRTI